MDNEERLRAILSAAAGKAHIDVRPEDIVIERSADKAHGDYATNLAMRYAKAAHKSPRDLAADIIKGIDDPSIEKIEVAGPGFINFFMRKESLGAIVAEVLSKGRDFGRGERNGQRINVEFVSANPTGDLHLGHTRGAALGDAVASLYDFAGYDVTREYYLNDCGNQVAHLGNSIRARYHELFGEECPLGDDDYHGEDIKGIAQAIKDEYGDRYLRDDEESKAFFVDYGIKAEFGKIMKDLDDFGVHFDKIIRESEIRRGGRIEKTIAYLRDKGYVYEKDGATYLKTTAFLDDKDRPIIKSDGSYTYFMPDICYHYDKVDRGYDLLVDMLGADHYGYINRMKSALMMRGCKEGILDAEIYQIVRVYRDGEEVKMSKRTGKAITHRELVEDIGKDAVRYFFSEKAAGQHLDFDYGLALSKSKDNPVYYAQYAHARCHSLLEMGKGFPLDPSLSGLSGEKEADILKQLADFPSMIKAAAALRAPNRVASYIQKLSAAIHGYYAANKIIDRDDPKGTSGRLAMMKAAMIVLESALGILGVSAPEKM
jgi:arginyl-tRNA synthetase